MRGLGVLKYMGDIFGIGCDWMDGLGLVEY